ncbi:MAG: HAD family phosphatase [archaeon]
MIKAIIFDYGGVISNNTDSMILEHISNSCKVPLNVTKKAIAGILEKYQTGAINDEMFWKEFKSKTGTDLPKNYLELWTETYEKELKINHDALNLIKNLRIEKYTLALLSNTIPPHTRYIKKHIKLFDHTILSTEAGLRKPDENIYILALKMIGNRPEECIYIDDIQEYLTPAGKLGIHTIHYKNIPLLKRELLKQGIHF